MRRRVRIRRMSLLVAVLALAAACGGPSTAKKLEPSSDTTAPSPSESSTDADSDTTFEGDPSTTIITVTDAGAEPRRELRFTYEEGSRQETVTEQNMTISMPGAGGQSSPTTIPQITLPMTCEVVDTDSHGSAKVEQGFGDIEIEDDGSLTPEQLAEFGVPFQQMSGTTTEITVSDRGEVIFVDASELSGASGMDMNQLASQAVPLPEEPLGVGATWTATSPVESNGIALERTATYRLTASEGDHLRIETDISVGLDPSGSSIDGVSISRLESTGTGWNELDLTQPCPSAFELTMHQEIEASDPASGETIQQTMDMSMSSTETG